MRLSFSIVADMKTSRFSRLGGRNGVWRRWMSGWSGDEIRTDFQGYFEKHGHQRVESSSLVPDGSDSSLLFVNAGMVPFKERFLGYERPTGESPSFSRATSVQKCVRAGGKHNDLDNVGFTPRHHTFFEMLGNFSFGDYFKEEAILLSWKYVTQQIKIPESKLRITVHKDDDESLKLWKKIAGESVPLHKLGDADNFWSMGEGEGLPCGPCSEIFFDTGVEGKDRYLEIWNLVFMQYQSTKTNQLEPLPKPCVDTGMGLERIAAVLQGVQSNFHCDLIAPLVTRANQITESHGGQPIEFCSNVIADHIRSSAFLIADGVIPSNIGRGYVLRRIIRRAAAFGYRVGIKSPFLASVLPTLMVSMGNAYPNLIERHKMIAEILTAEEISFGPILDTGFSTIDEQERKHGSISAEVAFQMQDTFGFPFDLTMVAAAERNIPVDKIGFQKLMEEQRQRSSSSSKFCSNTSWQMEKKVKPVFTGYQNLCENDSKVLAIVEQDNSAWVSISPCPFYAESGGQAGDRGQLITESGLVVPVLDTVRPYQGGIALRIDIDQVPNIHTNDAIVASVDADNRQQISLHHTATHVLQSALRQVLGETVTQTGSSVSANRLRFDFHHAQTISEDELREIERIVNSIALENRTIQTQEMTIEQAKALNATMLFSEKYGNLVRVVSVGDPCTTQDIRSVELCGGTHASRSIELFPFKILSESSVASGTRRIEALSGPAAVKWYEKRVECLQTVGKEVKSPSFDSETIVSTVRKLVQQEASLKKSLRKLRKDFVNTALAPCAVRDYINLYNVQDDSPDDPKASLNVVRELANSMVKNDPNRLHVFLSGSNLVIFATGLSSVNAGVTLRECLRLVGGKGGGSAQFAQGKFDQPRCEKFCIDSFLEKIRDCLNK